MDVVMLPTSFADIMRFSILETKWEYRGEGNANLVLALPKDRMILRLHKYRRDAPITDELKCEEMNRVWREAYFCRTIMVPLLGNAYIQPPRIAKVRDEEILSLDNFLLPQRPNFRHHKGIRFGYVNIYPDYALLPEKLSRNHTLRSDSETVGVECDGDQSMGINGNCIMSYNQLNSNTDDPIFCVEIKPKQGWIPCSDMHRHPKCTFCLNQYLKLYNGDISQISQYCPLDLFSGDEKRTKEAIKSLLKTPQNNLKIFKNGYLVYSEDKTEDLTLILEEWLGRDGISSSNELKPLVDSFSSLVYHALTTNLLGDVDYMPFDDQYVPLICVPEQNSPIDHSLLRQLKPCDLSSRRLPFNCILDRILWIQKLQQSDTNSIDHILWKNSDCGDYDYVARLFDPKTNRLCLDQVKRYLLATTAKDCSILMAFRRVTGGECVPPAHTVVDSAGTRYVFNIGVSDLDPKPLSCVRKHCKRDSEIQHAVCQLLSAFDNAA